MKHRKIASGLLTAALTACCICGASLSAAAITADDVAQKAREAGWPDYLIQIGYNQWSSGEYTEADLQRAYNSVSTYSSEVEDMICAMFGVDPPAHPAETQAPTAAPTPAPTAAPTEAPAANPAETTPAAPASGTVSTDAPTENGGGNTSGGSTPGGSTPGGSTSGDTGQSSGKVSSAEFISMTLEEKIDYVNSLPEDERTDFVANLTPEEKNSILRQMPLEDQAELMQQYIDVANTMGVNVVVDSLTDENISVVVRDEDGVVIDNAAVGVTIDETGISHTTPIMFAVGGVLLAAVGFAALYFAAGRE